MNLSDLYNIADKEKIKIYDHYIEKETLAEELGHYYQDATYPINCTDTTLISKQEYRAKKYARMVLIPYENLKLAILKRN